MNSPRLPKVPPAAILYRQFTAIVVHHRLALRSGTWVAAAVLAVALLMATDQSGAGESTRAQSLPKSGTTSVTGRNSQATSSRANESWQRDPGGNHYSTLAQIDTRNVWRLEEVWNWQNSNRGNKPAAAANLAVTDASAAPQLLPDAAGGALLSCTGSNQVVALDPATGAERWRATLPPAINRTSGAASAPGGTMAPQAQSCRSISYWHDPAASASSAPSCAHRILAGTGDGRLLALDATTGKRCVDFGNQGQVDLTALLAADHAPAAVHHTSIGDTLPVVIGNLIVVSYNDETPDNPSHQMLVAVDARSGTPRWTSTLQGPASAYSPQLVADADRNLVVAATPDILLALHADTGDLLWRFPMSSSRNHYKPSKPLLVDISLGNKRMPAVAIVTAQAMTLVLDRTTGTPLLPVTGSRLTGPDLTPDDAWGLTFWDETRCRDQIVGARRIVPDSSAIASLEDDQPWIEFPGSLDDTPWHGVAFDPARNLLITSLPRVGIYYTPASTGTRPQLFLGPAGLPCTAPPWSILVGVDLANGGVHWQVPLTTAGSVMKSVLARSPSKWSGPLAGSPLITAGQLTFIGVPGSQRLLAFDTETAHEVWSMPLPAPARFAPITYERNGRQFLVVAGASGPAVNDNRSSDYLMAYALPQKYLQTRD
ncbi:MAG: PQQ-binding-like beta-propeller repeat protein [Gammaproteobacteria bacterium]